MDAYELEPLHTPPAVASVSVMDKPVQTLLGPVMAAGFALIVTIFEALQPVVPKE